MTLSSVCSPLLPLSEALWVKVGGTAGSNKTVVLLGISAFEQEKWKLL